MDRVCWKKLKLLLGGIVGDGTQEDIEGSSIRFDNSLLKEKDSMNITIGGDERSPCQTFDAGDDTKMSNIISISKKFCVGSVFLFVKAWLTEIRPPLEAEILVKLLLVTATEYVVIEGGAEPELGMGVETL